MESIQRANKVFSLLIVEDDKSAIEVLSLMIPLKFPATRINIAEDGRKGVELGKARTPDIVITDINMPGMDGLKMAEEIKRMKADTKFIVLTGYSDKAHLDQLGAMGITDYIVKPIEFKKLFAAIERCMDEINRELG